MTPQEINEAVARKLGWEWYAREDIEGWYKAGELYLLNLPDYCHSIAAAWEVVECVAKTKAFEIICVGEKSICSFENRTYLGEPDEWVETADTAPMAICLAFLKV